MLLRRARDGASDRRGTVSRGGRISYARSRTAALEAVEPARIVAARASPRSRTSRDDRRHAALDLTVADALRATTARAPPADSSPRRFSLSTFTFDLLFHFSTVQLFRIHMTILFSGYSTMPWPPAAFSFGIRSRTVRLFDDRVHRHPLRVAQRRDRRRCSAGSTASTPSRSSRRTLSMSPTRPCAAMAALQQQRDVVDLGRFHASASASCWRSVACSIRALCRGCAGDWRAAYDPVSVASTMASARTGGFTSVAPQENSTLARGRFAARSSCAGHLHQLGGDGRAGEILRAT